MIADIIYVDNEPDDLLRPAREAGVEARFEPCTTPAEVRLEHAAAANLWVFDFFNDEAQRENPTFDGVKSNGLSVFHHLRLMVRGARPPAVLVSSDLERAVGEELDLRRRHVLADQVGVDWICPKVSKGIDPIAEIIAIADGAGQVRAVAEALGEAEPADYVDVLAKEVLGLARSDWSSAAHAQVAKWRPPVPPPNEAGKPSAADGTRLARDIVAWMLRQVLPYPSFLLRTSHFALALGIAPDCLERALREDTELARSAAAVRYDGILRNFAGDRWWSAGIDALGWELPKSRDQRRERLQRLLGPVELVMLDVANPVVVSDADLIEGDEIASASECVRASDEFFPPEAGPAWVRISDAKDDRVLASKVKLEDQGELATPQ